MKRRNNLCFTLFFVLLCSFFYLIPCLIFTGVNYQHYEQCVFQSLFNYKDECLYFMLFYFKVRYKYQTSSQIGCQCRGNLI